MARFTLHVSTSDDVGEMLDAITELYGVTKTTWLRPHIIRVITAEWNLIHAPDAAAYHWKVIRRAMLSHNHTVEEIVNWTGLPREIVLITLNEKLEAGTLRTQRGQYKKLTYFLNEEPHEKTTK